MATASDRQLEQDIRALLSGAGIPVDASVENGVATLVGRVTSPEIHQAALDLAGSVSGVASIDDQIDYEVVSPDAVYEEPDDDMEFDFADQAALDDSLTSVDPDFDEPTDAGGGADPSSFQEAVEEAYAYFPPTDPVVRPSDDDQELEILGGFSETSMEDVEDPQQEAFAERGDEDMEDVILTRDDDDIQADVMQELRRDALTTDLDLDVEVVDAVVFVRGTVPTIDDAENAEAVASRVPGIREVRDLTVVEP